MSRIVVRQDADSFDEISAEVVTDCSGDPGPVRPEFAKDSDINVIFARYGFNAPQQPGAGFVEYNTDLDLTTIMNTRLDMERKFLELPLGVRRRYPSWPDVIAAIHKGELVFNPEGFSEPPKSDSNEGAKS